MRAVSHFRLSYPRQAATDGVNEVYALIMFLVIIKPAHTKPYLFLSSPVLLACTRPSSRIRR